MKTKTMNYWIIALLVGASFLTQGCYHYRIASAVQDPSTSYQKKTVNSYFWGLVQGKKENGIDVVTKNCDSININKIDEVVVSTNFGYALITVVTLGIWCPMEIKWKCAKPCEREGEIR
jgi:hypothetical protein